MSRYVSSKGSEIKASGSLLSRPARVYIVLTSRFRNETLFLRAHSQKMSSKKLKKQPVVNVPIFKFKDERVKTSVSNENKFSLNYNVQILIVLALERYHGCALPRLRQVVLKWEVISLLFYSVSYQAPW